MAQVKIEKYNQVTQKWEEGETDDSYLQPLEPFYNGEQIESQIDDACDDIVETSLKMMGNTQNEHGKIEKN